MALWLCLQKFEGLIGGGPNPTRFIPGQIVDDTQDNVTAAVAAGAALVPYVGGMATAVAQFNESYGAKAPDQSIVPKLEAAGVLPSSVSATADAAAAQGTADGAVIDAAAAQATADAAALADTATRARTGAPELDLYDNGGTATLTAAGQATVFRGRNLTQGQAFSHLVLGASLDIIAEVPGVAGNAIQVEVVDTGGAGPSTVAYAAGVLTIDLVGLTPNEDAIAALINAGASAWTGILRANSGGGPAFGVVAATNLAGGSGSGFTVTAAGEACALTGEAGGLATSTASLTDTALAMTTPNLTAGGAAAGDVAKIAIVSDGYESSFGPLVLA